MRFALITPSYAPDFERCALLAESAKRFAPQDVTHYIIVDRRDLERFRQLEGERTKLLVVEDLIPWWIVRLPGVKKWWLSLKTKPVRNWVLQQLVKLSMAEVLDEDAFIYTDSDVTFVRPFTTDRFLDDRGRLRLNRVVFTSADHDLWHATARKRLGITPTNSVTGQPLENVNYVGSLITWRRDNVLAMYRRLKTENGRAWLRAVLMDWHLSEYTIYGNFVEHVVGLDEARHFVGDTPVLHLSWGYDLTDDTEVDRFFSDLKPEHIGIMVHSKDAIALDQYRDRVHRIWDRAH